MISTRNGLFLQTYISLQSSCSNVLTDRKSHPGRMGLRDLIGWPRTWSPQRGQVRDAVCVWCVADVSPSTSACAWHSVCSFIWHWHSDVAPEPHRQERFGNSEVPFPEDWAPSIPSTQVTIHCSPTAASPHRSKRLRPARFGGFPLFLCSIFCSIPVFSSATSQSWWKS